MLPEKTDYDEDCCQACCNAHLLCDVTARMIDRYNKELGLGEINYHDFVDVHYFRLMENFNSAESYVRRDRRSRYLFYFNVAVVEHYEDLLKNLENILEKMEPQIVQDTILYDEYVRKTSDDGFAEKSKMDLSDFKLRYASEIAAYKASRDYGQDKELINRTLNEMFLASNGQWIPEMVEVRDYMGTGKPRTIEGPGSEKLSRIAQAAREGQLRLQIFANASVMSGTEIAQKPKPKRGRLLSLILGHGS